MTRRQFQIFTTLAAAVIFYLLSPPLGTIGIAGMDGGVSMERFMRAANAYSAGDYATAQDALLGLVESGVTNGGIYYNLGNAYLKDGQIGPAILWYERAQQLTAGDPDLEFNLAYARTLTVDAAEETEGPLMKVLFFWRQRVSSTTIQWIALAINGMLWGLLILSALRPGKTANSLRLAAMVLAVSIIAVVTYDMYDSRHRNQGIVLPEKIAIRAGLHPTDTELFVLHAGAKVRIRKQLPGHYQVQFSEGKLGWVAKDAIGKI